MGRRVGAAGFLLLALLFWCSAAFAGDPYEDPRLQRWNAAFTAADRNLDALIRDTEADIRSGAMHPYAPHIWAEAMYLEGRLDGGWRDHVAPDLAALLGDFPDFFLADEGDDEARTTRMANAFPVEGKVLWSARMLAKWDTDDPAMDAALNLAALKDSNEEFYQLWDLQSTAEDLRSTRAEAEKILAARANPDDLFGRTAKALLAGATALTAGRQLEIVDAWLAEHSHDAFALRFKAATLDGLNRSEEALDLLRRSVASFPYRSADPRRFANYAVKVMPEQQLRPELTMMLQRIIPLAPATLADRSDALIANAYRLAGDKGAARRILETALARSPSSVELNRVMADLELDSGRTAEAESFATVASGSASPSKRDIERSLQIAATRADAGRVAALVASFRQHFGKLSSDAYYQAGRLNKDGSTEAIAFGREFLKAHPNDEWANRYLIYNLVEAGKPESEQGLIDEWLSRFVIPATNGQRLYFDYLKATKDHDAALAAFRAMQDRWGSYETYWQLLAGEETGDMAKLVFWQGVHRTLPGKAFPIERITGFLNDQRRFPETMELLDKAASTITEAGERATLLYSRCHVVAVMDASPGDEGAALYRKARTDCEEAERLGYARSDTRYQIAMLSNFYSTAPEAIADWETSIRISPDFDGARTLPFYGKLSEDLPRPRVFASLYDWYQRDPFDGDRITEAAHRHAKWGGSDIWAKLLYERLKVVAPDKFREHEADYDQINAGFESAAENFVKRYGAAKYISSSLRYVGWFNSSRLAAERRSPTVTLDPDTITKTVTQPDGQRLVQTEDPVNGTITYRAQGGTWQRFHYDGRGNLVKVEASGGAGVKITYDEHDQISRIETNGRTLTFTYNAQRKPIVVTLEKVGKIDVTYDAAGKIEGVKSDGGSNVAIQVSMAMQDLLSLVDQTKTGSFRDEQREAEMSRLRDKLSELEETPDASELLATAKAMMPYLDGAEEDFDTIEGLLLGLTAQADKNPREAGEAAALLADLYATLFPAGLDRGYWDHWQQALRALDKSTSPELAQLRDMLRAKPISLLPEARWLAQSTLANPGYWMKYELADYVPKPLREGLRFRTIHATADGRVIIASSAGLFIRQNGFWLRYLVDPAAGKLIQAAPSVDATALSDVLAIADRADGGLWLGTADGLVSVSPKGDIEARYQSTADGLAARRVTHLASWRGGIIALGADGLSFFDARGAHADIASELSADKVLARLEPDFVAAVSANEVLLGANGGVWLLSPKEEPRKIAAFAGRAALASGDGQVYLAAARDVYRIERGADGRLATPSPLSGRQDLQVSQSLYGLAEIDVGDGEAKALAMLSDLGIGFYHRGYIEHLSLPLSSEQKPALAISSAGSSFWVLSDAGALYAFQQGQVSVDTKGPVYNLATDPVGRVTYMARDGSVQAILQDGAPEPRYLFAAQVKKMIPIPNGILFNDGSDIMRYRTGDELPELLFSAANDVEHYRSETARDADNNEITGLALGPDGAIWATTRTSVFRHLAGKTTEFSYFRDPKQFPMPASWIAGVYTTVDGRVWVVGSDEGHIDIDGTNMRGGLAEWTGDGFTLLGDSDALSGAPWFMTSYTSIGNGRAIVGTAAGMALHEAGRFNYVERLKDSSYLSLLQTHPNLFLGGRGVAIGKDVWLFPTAAGVIGLRNDEWFYPDRLNQLLPDRQLARYGAHMVHAVETDAKGRIYAGTDRGLLVFDTGGGDAADFLIANGMRQEAFERQEEEALRRQRDIFIKGLDADDPRAKLARRYLQLEDEVSKLAVEQRMRAASTMTAKLAARVPTSSDKDEAAAQPNESAEKIRQLVEQRQKQMARVLDQLERESEGMVQMLQMKPLDLAALQKEIPAGNVMVQYIPTGKKLFIHVVSHDERSVREVDVDAQSLFAEARLVRSRLQISAETLRGVRSGVSLVPSGMGLAGNETTPQESDRLLYDGLNRLYKLLVLPVEDVIGGYKHVYFVPSGALTEVPFASLISQRGDKNRFIVEDHTIGLMPSLYLLHVYLTHLASASQQMLILGDPDGSLPGARQEAEEIRNRVAMTTELRLGDAASYTSFAELGPQSRAVHLATHGVLDPARPEDSYLLLSASRKLKLIDIQLMNFADTDLVFLSACETGLGGEGVEFQTLARAFAHAGVPTVAATLWQVSDAATLDLAKRFYEHYDNDALEAMAAAQREMIKAGSYTHPSAWAGFVIMGMP